MDMKKAFNRIPINKIFSGKQRSIQEIMQLYIKKKYETIVSTTIRVRQGNILLSEMLNVQVSTKEKHSGT